MNETAQYGKLSRLFEKNFIDYSAYVIKDRAIPDVDDGLKPVQRRILQTLFNMEDGRFHKVANVVGETMKLHPHGDASIFAALVNLANKGYLIDRQGNFGNIYTGDDASAARYIECRLSPLAKETLFNKDLTELVDSYDGRMQEPVSLPAKIPLLLLQGTEGIAVGMATKVLPHNFCELLSAQKKLLAGETVEIYPDFPFGGIVDVSNYNAGNGRVRVRARIVEKDEKTILIKEIPYGTTTESLMESIERAARSGKIKITSVNDYTAEEVEIEVKLARGVYAKDTIPALYALTDCEVAISPNLTVIQGRSPVTLTVDAVLKHNTDKLLADLERELFIELGRLRERLHAHILEQLFIEERLYKQIEECITYKIVIATIDQALQPFADQLVRPVTKDDIERLLEIRIKRISRYDIDRKRKEIAEVRTNIRKVEKHLANMVGFTISYLDDLLKRYGDQHPRLTKMETFEEVTARDIAVADLTMGYDRESGFLGHAIKGPVETSFPCSEFDKILLIFRNGLYKVISVVEKLFVGPDLLWLGRVEEKTVFNVIYREGAQNLCYVKRFHTPKFILDKEYHLFPELPQSRIEYLKTGPGCRVRVRYQPSKRSKSNFEEIAFDELLIKGAAALGKRVSTRVVRAITELPPDQEAVSETPPTPLSILDIASADQGPPQEPES